MFRFVSLLLVSMIPAAGFAHSDHPERPSATTGSQTILVIGDGTSFAYAPAVMRERPRTAEPPGDRDDPAYAAYKEGYRLILNEQWDDARKKFAELLGRYKKSKYRADAEYWSAYALKHLNRKSAIHAYETFIERHPHSTYIDDVVADLAELQARASLAGALDSATVAVTVRPAIVPTPSSAPAAIRGLTFNIRRLDRAMHREFNPERMGYLAGVPFPMVTAVGDGKLSREIKLKMNALRALGEIRGDTESYSTLREIALDQAQPRPLRSVALTELANFPNEEIVPVLVQVAEKDSDATIRSSAVYCIASTRDDPGKKFDLLCQIYRKTPQSRLDDRQGILTTIASVGKDRAVDFLATVARTENNPDVALSAIDAIVETGADKNRVVETLVSLYDETPASKTDQRETILYTVADVGNDRAVDFLGNVALKDADYDARGSAVYLLGTIGGEKARTVLFQVLKEH